MYNITTHKSSRKTLKVLTSKLQYLDSDVEEEIMETTGIMNAELKTKINRCRPKHLRLVCSISLSREDIHSGSLELKLPWSVCGFPLDFSPYQPRPVVFMSTRHPKTNMELERHGNHKYRLKNGWSSVVETENLRVGDDILVWAFADATNTKLYFAMHHQEGSDSNF